MKYENKKTLFDVTVFNGHKEYQSHHEVIEAAAPLFKKFVFQKELCPDTEREHWQFRGALHKQETCGAVLKTIVPKFPGNWSLTSSTVHDNAKTFNYVMKEQTRVAGPWSDQDIAEEPPKMTKQLDLFINGGEYQGEILEPGIMEWHTQIEEFISHFNMRSILLIYDVHGNSRKSLFAEYLEYKGLALEVPPMSLMEDIMQFCYCFKDQKCYLVDMPRALKKTQLSQFYSGLEALKDGKVYDKRYSAKKRRMDRPHIVVFTNTLPKWEYMSPDRWMVKEMTLEKKLIDHEFSG